MLYEQSHIVILLLAVSGHRHLSSRAKIIRSYSHNKHECTIYRSGTGGRCCIGAGQTLCVHSPDGSTFIPSNDVMAAILKLWRHNRNVTPSINAYLLAEQSSQISSQSDLKWRTLVLFGEVPNKKKNKMSRVPDLKMIKHGSMHPLQKSCFLDFIMGSHLWRT